MLNLLDRLSPSQASHPNSKPAALPAPLHGLKRPGCLGLLTSCTKLPPKVLPIAGYADSPRGAPEAARGSWFAPEAR